MRLNSLKSHKFTQHLEVRPLSYKCHSSTTAVDLVCSGVVEPHVESVSRCGPHRSTSYTLHMPHMTAVGVGLCVSVTVDGSAELSVGAVQESTDMLTNMDRSSL